MRQCSNHTIETEFPQNQLAASEHAKHQQQIVQHFLRLAHLAQRRTPIQVLPQGYTQKSDALYQIDISMSNCTSHSQKKGYQNSAPGVLLLQIPFWHPSESGVLFSTFLEA